MTCEFCDHWQYKEQQSFLNEVAERLGVVCCRPDYHKKSGDKNTVLFYTKEDEAHNRKVDKQPVQYSRSEAHDRHITDESCIYRDHFWWFENSDRNGQYDHDFANFGRLDLRSSRWKEALEGDIRLALAKKWEKDYLIGCGGAFGLREADEVYNGLNREMVKAMKMRYGKCFLGKVNFYDDEIKSVAAGEKSVFTEYTGQKVYDFGCAFCVPEENDQLVDLIVKWNQKTKVETMEAIVDLVEKIGGCNFIWT